MKNRALVIRGWEWIVALTTAGGRPADFSDVRTTNLTIVLGCVSRQAPCSRAEIAAATGLNKATVSSLVAELIERRLLRETGQAAHRIGRPATLLELDGAAYATLGLSVAVDALTLVATDLAGQTLVSWHRPVRMASRGGGPAETIAMIAALARKAIGRLRNQRRSVLGITVAVPGVVAPSGLVTTASAVGWREVDIATPLYRALRTPTIPISIENDANVAALAEYRGGRHPNTSNLVYLMGGAGIGAGVIADGRLVRGGSGFAGEIGHLPLGWRFTARLESPRGGRASRRCACGLLGCLDTVAGPLAITSRLSPRAGYDPGSADRSVRRTGAEIPESGETAAAWRDLPARVCDVAARAEAGEAEALSVLEQAGRALGQVAAFLGRVVNPEVVVLGGHLATLAPWLLPPARAELATWTLSGETGGCGIVDSTLDQRAIALGAAARALCAAGSEPVSAFARF